MENEDCVNIKREENTGNISSCRMRKEDETEVIKDQKG